MANKTYIILTSWDEVLYRVEAWSSNYYFIKMYYNQYIETHPEAIIVEYEMHDGFRVTALIRKIGLDYGACALENFATSELKLCTSLDGKLNAIYKSMYDCSFKTKSYYLDTWVYDDISSIISGVFMSTAPLIKFIYLDIDLLELLFKAYSYTSKVSKTTELDMVYVWYLILRMPTSRFMRYNLILDHRQDLIPVHSVFMNE